MRLENCYEKLERTLCQTEVGVARQINGYTHALLPALTVPYTLLPELSR